MDNNSKEIFAAFGINPEEIKVQEKNEVLVFRLNPNRYIKKSGTVWATDNKSCIKLEIYNGHRLSKSFSVYEDSASDVYQQAQELYTKVATSHLMDVVPATVNQYKR